MPFHLEICALPNSWQSQISRTQHLKKALPHGVLIGYSYMYSYIYIYTSLSLSLYINKCMQIERESPLFWSWRHHFLSPNRFWMANLKDDLWKNRSKVEMQKCQP